MPDFDWLEKAFITPSAVQAVIVLSLVSALGLSLGKVKLRGISLGVTFVFFIGILAGASGLSLDPRMSDYAESFGLILFVYALGLQVGPGFVGSFRKGGARLNLLSLGVILLGTVMAVGLATLTDVSFPAMVGVLCGAVTNTPALGAAQQTLTQMGLSGTEPALSCALTYPFGLVGVILALIMLRVWLKSTIRHNEMSDDEAYIASFEVCNPAVFGRKLNELNTMQSSKFVVSRLWRDGEVILPDAETMINAADRILVITTRKSLAALTILFGKLEEKDWNKAEFDWNKVDHDLISQRIIITRHEINGRHLGALQLRNRYGVNISRVQRSGIQLVATPDLTLMLGDRLTVVGHADELRKVADELGNAVKDLEEPNLVAIFIGIGIGMLFGTLPLTLPGISYPVQLGIAGGPILLGILIGAYGPRLHMVTYTTTSANRMLRALGLTLYLACLGLNAGTDFFDVVLRQDALVWIFSGFAITLLPIIIIAFVSAYFGKNDFATTAGMLCGSMANPIALDYVNSTLPGDKAAVSYATVYPMGMFLRVIIAQVLIRSFMGV